MYIFYLINRIGCIEKVVKNEADFLPLEPEEIYLAQRFKGSGFSVISEIRLEDFKDRKMIVKMIDKTFFFIL